MLDSNVLLVLNMELSVFGSRITREYVPSLNFFTTCLPEGVEYLGTVNGGCHAAYAHKDSMSVFEYCEGDMITISSSDENQFDSEVLRTRAFILDN